MFVGRPSRQHRLRTWFFESITSLQAELDEISPELAEGMEAQRKVDALQALGNIGRRGGDAAKDMVLGQLQHESDEVRLAAVEALGNVLLQQYQRNNCGDIPIQILSHQPRVKDPVSSICAAPKAPMLALPAPASGSQAAIEDRVLDSPMPIVRADSGSSAISVASVDDAATVAASVDNMVEKMRAQIRKPIEKDIGDEEKYVKGQCAADHKPGGGTAGKKIPVAFKRPAAATPVAFKRTIVLGCTKCRRSESGCSQCQNPAFSGKRGRR